MAINNLYYNNNEATKQIITEVELNAHDTSDNAHKEKFDKYTLQNPIGIWNAMYQLGPNYTYTDQSTKGFAKLGLFASVYDSKNVFEQQPSQYGTLLNIPTTINDSEFITVTQFWFDQSGDLFIRTGTVNNPINKIAFTKVTLATDIFNKYGEAFPATNLVPGMIFYRTDENKLYVYMPTDGGSSWKMIYDLNKDANIADGLSHPWHKLDDSTDDTTIPKLADSENMNTYITPGVYSCVSGQIAGSLVNKPSGVNSNFRLIVEENIQGYGTQKVYTNNPCKIYIRGFSTTNNKTTFTDWKVLLNNTDTALTAETANRDSAGNIIKDTYVKKSGDTMTGGITFNKTATANSFIGPGEADIADAITANQANTKIISWQTIGIKKSDTDPYVISMNSRTGDIHTKGKIIGDSTATFTGTVTAPTFNGHATEASMVSYKSTDGSKMINAVQCTQADGDGFAIRQGINGDCALYLMINDAGNGANKSSIIVQSRGNNYADLYGQAVLLDSSLNTSFPGVLTATRVVNAQYNDYAEFFERGEDTEAGDIIALDISSDEEKYIKATNDNNIIVGIHSDEFAHIIGGEKGKTLEENLINFIPVALAGRVHVKVSGIVHKGDKIILSNTPGVGTAYNSNYSNNKTIVGIALENNKNPEIKLVRVLLKWGEN